MLGLGNQKLGPFIHSWSLPSPQTCPGRSPLCERLCYGRRGRFLLPEIRKRLAANLAASQSGDFVRRMCREVRRQWAQVVRVHVAGDFYAADYVQAWHEIAGRCARTEFLAYTRSWRSPELLAELVKLGRLKNVHLFASCDRQTDLPRDAAPLRRVYMAVDDQDAPPPGFDLVFRVNRRSRLKRLGGVLVCPAENGVSDLTCTQCRLCWRSRSWGRGRVV